MDSFQIDGLAFDERGLIPAVVQQNGTREVLMVAWMSAESIRLTFETGTTWFWSRSRHELSNRGAVIGAVQRVIEIWTDADADTLLVLVDTSASEPATGPRGCFRTRVG